MARYPRILRNRETRLQRRREDRAIQAEMLSNSGVGRSTGDIRAPLRDRLRTVPDTQFASERHRTAALGCGRGMPAVGRTRTFLDGAESVKSPGPHRGLPPPRPRDHRLGKLAGTRALACKPAPHSTMCSMSPDRPRPGTPPGRAARGAQLHCRVRRAPRRRRGHARRAYGNAGAGGEVAGADCGLVQ